MKRGAKKKAPADKRSASIRILLTPAEKVEIDSFAIDIGTDVGTWVRSTILEAIRRHRPRV